MNSKDLPWIRLSAKQRSKIALNNDEDDEEGGDERGNEDGVVNTASEAEVAAASDDETELGEKRLMAKITDGASQRISDTKANMKKVQADRDAAARVRSASLKEQKAVAKTGVF